MVKLLQVYRYWDDWKPDCKTSTIDLQKVCCHHDNSKAVMVAKLMELGFHLPIQKRICCHTVSFFSLQFHFFHTFISAKMYQRFPQAFTLFVFSQICSTSVRKIISVKSQPHLARLTAFSITFIKPKKKSGTVKARDFRGQSKLSKRERGREMFISKFSLALVAPHFL